MKGFKKFLLGLLIVIVSVATALLIQNFPTVKGWFTKDATLGVGEYNLTKIITEDNLIEYPDGYENMYDLGLTKSSLEKNVQYKIELLNEDGDVISTSICKFVLNLSDFGLNGELEDDAFVLLPEECDTVGVMITYNCEFVNSTEIETIEGSRIIFNTDGHELPEGITTMKISVVEE